MPKISEQKKDTIRTDILNTAKVIFHEKGYEAASMKDIVNRSGRSFGGVYMYFSNKEDVFLALLRQQFGEMASTLEPESERGAWGVMLQFLNEQERRVSEVDNGLAACMYEYFIVGRREESRRKLIDERYEEIFRSVSGLIHAGVRSGEFHPSQSVETITHWLIATLDGLFVETIMNGAGKLALAKQFELLQTICRSLLQPAAKENER